MNYIKQISEEKNVALAALCDNLQISRATLYRVHNDDSGSNIINCLAKKPHNAISDAEKQRILDVMHSKRFIDSSPYDVFYTLLDEGQYLGSIRTMYRVLFEAGESKDRRNQRHHRDAVKPELIATAPNEVWSWDISVPQQAA